MCVCVCCVFVFMWLRPLNLWLLRAAVYDDRFTDSFFHLFLLAIEFIFKSFNLSNLHGLAGWESWTNVSVKAFFTIDKQLRVLHTSLAHSLGPIGHSFIMRNRINFHLCPRLALRMRSLPSSSSSSLSRKRRTS